MWELNYKESWAPKNWCFWTVVLEKTLESPLDCKELKPVNPKGNKSCIFIWNDWCWSWNSNTLATSCEELTHWKTPWCWARLKAGGEGGEMVGWYHHLYWHEFESSWWTGKPDMLQPMGSQRVRHGWATEKNWTETEVQVQASRTLTSLSRRVVQK